MPDQESTPQPTDLEETNAKLKQSLERCRELLSECHAKLESGTGERALPEEDAKQP